MNPTEATDRLLEAAEDLFYAHGVQAVGMDAVRARSGVSLKRLYQSFPSKNDLVEAYLRRRDERWRASLRDFVHARGDDPLAVFDWLGNWFAEPGFRGCAFVNSFGEFGEPAPGIAAVIRKHKDRGPGLPAWSRSRPEPRRPAVLARGRRDRAGRDHRRTGRSRHSPRSREGPPGSSAVERQPRVERDLRQLREAQRRRRHVRGRHPASRASATFSASTMMPVPSGFATFDRLTVGPRGG